jgi:hypothetical protein
MKKKSISLHRKTNSNVENNKDSNTNLILETTKEKRYNTEANFIDTNNDFSTGDCSSQIEVLKKMSKETEKLNKPKSARINSNKINITFDLQKTTQISSSKDNLSKEQKEIQYKNQLFFLKIYIIAQLVIDIFDLFFVVIFSRIFLNIFNIIALFLIFFLACFMYKEFKLSEKEINRQYYKHIKKIIKLVGVIMGIFFFDMMYEIIVEMLINNLIEFDSSDIFMWTLFILFYVVANITIPVLIIMQLTEIKKTIKQIGKLEGKDFSLTTSNSGTNTELYIIEQNKTD